MTVKGSEKLFKDLENKPSAHTQKKVQVLIKLFRP